VPAKLKPTSSLYF